MAKKWWHAVVDGTTHEVKYLGDSIVIASTEYKPGDLCGAAIAGDPDVGKREALKDAMKGTQ